MACVKDEVHCVKVICDDTDVFVLLTVSVFWKGCKSKVLMEAFDTSKLLIGINETAKSHHSLILMHFLVAILCQSYMVLERRRS